MKTVMHPNMAEFEKMIGVRTLVQKSDDSGDDSTCLGSDTPSEEEGLICQSCHTVVKINRVSRRMGLVNRKDSTIENQDQPI